MADPAGLSLDLYVAGEAAFGPVGIRVANAGVSSSHGFRAEDEAVWRQSWDMVTDVTVKGTATTLRAGVPAMAARGSGRVIVIASTFGRQGNGSHPAYIASKPATMGMIKALAIEVGKSGVTVNGIVPTAMQTGFGGPQAR